MKRFLSLFLVLAACGAVGACGLTKEKLGMKKTAPNEFMSTSRAPLTLPPEYDLLPVNQEKYNNPGMADDDDLSGGERSLLENINKADGK